MYKKNSINLSSVLYLNEVV